MLLRFAVALWIFSTLPVQAQTPQVVDGGVLNGASFAKGQPVAPGSLVSIFGSDLASSTAQYDSVPVSTTLEDVSVKFNNTAAPLTLVSGGQINALVPWKILPQGASEPATVVVTRGGRQSAPVQFSIAATAPGVFSIPPGAGQAVAVNADGTIAGPPGVIPDIQSHPAKIGDSGGLIIYANGLGAVDSPITDGAVSQDKIRNTLVTPTVLVGGVPVQVVFSGLSPQFPGVNQVNVFLPPGTPVGTNLPLQIRIGDITSSDQVLISTSQ